MKEKFKLGITVALVVCGISSVAQLNSFSTSVTEDMYIDYQKYLNDAFKVFDGNKGSNAPSAKQIQDSSAILVEESAVSVPVKTGNSKIMHSENIFSKRKNSVFIMGKFERKDASGNINFELSGTAFAIAENGICVTNYHLLKDIINKSDSAAIRDSIYFIITSSKKVYFIEKILAYSQNNDIAVFKTNTMGDKLLPIPFGKAARVGALVYCLSHPYGHFYSFSSGIVSRNIVTDSSTAAAGYNNRGRLPIRMEITADYGIGSSGGPILDKSGNLIGVVSSTTPIVHPEAHHQQMVVKDAIPVKALKALLEE